MKCWKNWTMAILFAMVVALGYTHVRGTDESQAQVGNLTTAYVAYRAPDFSSFCDKECADRLARREAQAIAAGSMRY